MKYRLVIEYRGGHDLKVDRKIEKTVGKKHSGAGYFIPDCSRDLSFLFSNKKVANSAAKKIRALRMKLRAAVYEETN